MSVDLLERPMSSDVLSHSQWQPRQRFSQRCPGGVPDITSQSRLVAIPFGEAYLALVQLPPVWSQDLLRRISELGMLERNWDSYGALPVPHNARGSSPIPP